MLRLKDIYERPLPPMCLTEYDALSKFLNDAMRRCEQSGRNFDMFLDWTIHALISSMTSDSAARIFLPKTKTAPFYLDDLFPISDIQPSGKKRIKLSDVNLIAPVWNNADLESALEAFYDSGFEAAEIDQQFGGAYIEEMNLAIIDSPSDVDVPYILRVWGRGSIQLDSYSLKALKPLINTDGVKWYIQGNDGEEYAEPVLEPRMASLYNCALRRYCADT